MKAINSWYIDSIDGRAGLAFTTRRDSDLTKDAPALEQGVTAFIAPPAFQPEFLECRSPGLALGRSHGQLGLLLNQAEVPFDSVEAVSEFVRRVYLRGSSGDGPGEGGGEGAGPPPSAEGPPPDLPEIEGASPSEQSDPVQVILDFAETMKGVSQELTLGASSDLTGLRTSGRIEIDKKAGTERLVRAAFRLISQVVQLNRSSYTRLKFAVLSENLICIFARMGLWPLLWQASSSGSRLRGWLEKDLGVLHWMREQWDRRFYYGRPPYLGYFGWMSQDPFDDLAHLPIPAVSSRTGEVFFSLQALLGLLCSTPLDLLNSDPATNARNAELALFAATCLNLGRDYAPTDYHSVAIAEDFLNERISKAVGWLFLNFPGRAYAQEVEATICEASLLDRQSWTSFQGPA